MKVLILAAMTASLFAQPKTENAKLDTRAVNGGLEAAFRTLVSSSADPAWIGYSVAQVPGERSMCGTVALEGGREFVVLYRVAAGQVEKIRTYATDCTFDAGDLPLHRSRASKREGRGRAGAQSRVCLLNGKCGAGSSDEKRPPVSPP